MNEKSILKSKKVRRFINSKHSASTRVRYEYFVKEFFLFVGENPDTYLVDNYEFLQPQEKQKIASRYKRDLQDFRNKLLNEPNKKGRDMKDPSIRTTLACIKSLFTYCEIDFPMAFWQRLNDFKNERTSIAETPTHEQLRKILDNTDIQGKCLFLIMATSGSRIDSVLQLRKKDIDMNHEYPRIVFSYRHVKSSITKVKRVTPECKHFLESYFSVLEGLTPDGILTPECKLFRMTRQNADYKWKCALKKAKLYKLDENTGRCTMTTQCLKRFFKSYFSRGKFSNNEKWEDYFAEHKSNLDSRYKDYDPEYIDEQYAKGVPYLLIWERPIDADIRIKQIRKENERIQKENELLQGKVQLLAIKSERNELEYEKRFQGLDQNLREALIQFNKNKNFERAYLMARQWWHNNAGDKAKETFNEIETKQIVKEFFQYLEEEAKTRSMTEITDELMRDLDGETDKRLQKIQKK